MSGEAESVSERRAGNRLGVAIPSKFEDVPGDGVPKKGDKLTSNNVAVRPVVDAMDRLDAAYERAKKLDCLESMVPSLIALGRPAPPPDLAAILAKFGKREDARRAFTERRDALLARHRTDADAAIEAVAKAREGARFDEAVALATYGRLDFAALPSVVAKFQAALAELGKDPAFAKATFSLGPKLAWRRDLVRALDLEAKAREKSAAGKKGGWKTVLGIYDGLMARAPSAEVKATLVEYVAPLKSAFGKAESSRPVVGWLPRRRIGRGAGYFAGKPEMRTTPKSSSFQTNRSVPSAVKIDAMS